MTTQQLLTTSWTQTLLRGMSDAQINEKNYCKRLYANQYVLFAHAIYDDPAAVCLPTLVKQYKSKTSVKYIGASVKQREVCYTVTNAELEGFSVVHDRFFKTIRNTSRDMLQHKHANFQRAVFVYKYLPRVSLVEIERY